MPKETLLKKQFKSSDVSRLRNLITGDHNEKTQTSVGYKKTDIKHNEGETWEEDGKTWTIKGGIKQNITKLDKIKNLVNVPLICPKCGGSMRHWLQKKMYYIHGFCFDPCTISFEKQLKKQGLYKQYENTVVKNNALHILNDLEHHLKNQVDQDISVVTEDGDIEDWSKLNSLQQKNKLGEFMQQINKLKQQFKQK